jgi:alkanesulfonate monooxygenase SsuD/methylene tetrahydromethanopterin reductase-like flavin-dependent oxidoreductase (luciferase family)
LIPLVAAQPVSAPPQTVAKTVHSLVTLYGRRVDLNLVTGAAAAELERVGDTAAHDERYARALEYMGVVRAMLTSDERLNHQGPHYELRGLTMGCALPANLRPRVFVAGSSDASRRVAGEVGHVMITHPEPLSTFTARTGTSPVQGGPATGIRLGLIARPTGEDAWDAAHAAYQQDQYARARLALMKRSQSQWNRTLAELASTKELYDDVYWTGTFRSGKGGFPLLVGDYGQVTRYLEGYLRAGVTVIVTGGVRTAEDFDHADVVLSALRG